jgi:signal transduction histidine kinase
VKFWQKAFLGILMAFIVSINICLFLISKYSFTLNLKSENDRALGEYHFIINGIYDAMNSIYYREQAAPSPSSIESLMGSYADYYKRQNIFFELRQANKPIFTNIPSKALVDSVSIIPSKDAFSVKVIQNNGIYYLYIDGKLGGLFEDYGLTYVRDLSELYNTHARLTRYLITVSVLVEILLALVLLLILRRLTRPIHILQKATNKIAGGVYNERVSILGKDEFHDLAENFNLMASSIQEKITELDKNAQNKQRLIDNLAHELRTPLTSIRGYAEYLQHANANEQMRIKAAGYIISEIDRMKNLSFKLLDLALVRNTKLDLQEIIILEVFKEVKEALTSKLEERGINLDVHTTLDKLIGDSILLQSLLINLIDNAIKASSDNSIIELTAYHDKVPILEVRDSGCGMEEEQALLVCEPFYRVDNARSRSSGGVGLGLSLCREIAQLHGAELRIITHPGNGTMVQIFFTTPLQLSENSVTVKDV